MATFTDKQNRQWRVELDAPTIEEILQKHQVNLVNLEADPLIKLRNDPMTLVSVVYMICQEQIETLGLTPRDFAKSLPTPPDPILDAVRDSIIGFFPTGRASHVQEVLAKYDEMNGKTDELTIAKMTQILKDPKTSQRLSSRLDKEMEKVFNEMFPLHSEPGT